MDRQHSYQILIGVMNEMIESEKNFSNCFVKSILKNVSGKTYTIELLVKNRKLFGSIHDNNSHKFEMLEEVLELGPAVKPRDDSGILAGSE